MTGQTKRKIVVSTLAEAELFAEWGFDDILYGFPIIEHNLKRCYDLLEKLDHFHLLLDNPLFIQDLMKFPPPSSKKWSIFVSINTGYQREGIVWNSDDILKSLIQSILSSDIATFMGVYTHCGNSYAPSDLDDVNSIASIACERVQHVKQILLDCGIETPVVSTGSTPSCSRQVEEFQHLNEIHPGNYVFYDVHQKTLGSCSAQDIAGKVATRIVGIYPASNYMLIDCGFLGLSNDHGDSVATYGYAEFENHPQLKLASMSQELGKVTSRDGKPLDWSRYKVNSLLYLYPWHSCATAAMFKVYYCHRGDGKIANTLKPCKHW